MKQLLLSLSMILLLVTAGACAPATTGGEPPVIVSFEASPATIGAGGRSQLSWNVSNARAVVIDNGVGAVALSGSRIVLPSLTTVYTITATNQYGTASATAQVLVSGVTKPSQQALPVISSFTAEPEHITAGSTAILSWYITDAASASINQGIGSVNAGSGSQSVSPSGTTTYILTATNAEGSVTQAVTVSVAALPSVSGIPVINSFIASPDVITPGSPTTLSWDVSGAANVSIISGTGTVLMVGSSGSAQTTPAVTQTYTLQATNSLGMASKSVTVTITEAEDTTPPSVPALLTPAAGATLPQPTSAWNFDWADSTDAESGIKQYELYVIRQGAGTPAIDTYTISSGYSVILGGSIPSANLNNWTWKVRAQNNTGIWSNWTATRTFDVSAPAVVSHTVTLSPVASETGGVYKDGTVSPSAKFAGDTSGNVAIRCYFSYDISTLAGKEVTSAKLNFTTSTVRDPFGHLGGLWVGKVNYGTGPLQASDYGLTSSPFASYAAPPAEINVTTAVNSAALAGDPRFQVRAHYASETNGDNLADYINFTGATLTITYNE